MHRRYFRNLRQFLKLCIRAYYSIHGKSLQIGVFHNCRKQKPKPRLFIKSCLTIQRVKLDEWKQKIVRIQARVSCFSDYVLRLLLFQKTAARIHFWPFGILFLMPIWLHRRLNSQKVMQMNLHQNAQELWRFCFIVFTPPGYVLKVEEEQFHTTFSHEQLLQGFRWARIWPSWEYHAGF